ncbi:Signal transduction histidine kinase [Streptomyces misionensis]|uniref:histidine kinase n=1 Tax=Streptomyces misionensis TaxID=67331 RepID=A0A1H5HQL6_9ACTN|nr:histidine kinase [Streptomyces misionensis]SEE30306.1 Signal transduction histidine kinase [Streptomyces misionensis]
MNSSSIQAWVVAVGRGAAVTFFATVATVSAAQRFSDGRYVVAIIASAVACAVVLLVPRLRWPIAPIVVAAVTAWWGWVGTLLLALVMYDLAAARRTRAAVLCAAAALGANLVGYPPTRLWHQQTYVTALFLWAFAYVVGLWIGNRRRLVRALAADVEHLHVEAQLREEAARIAERSRIAAEMHDVLAHRLSLIALHTGVLATRSDPLPGPIAERLALLRDASTEALADLRDVLGVLRTPGTAPNSADAVPAPVPGDVQQLVDDARAASQPIAMTVHGRPEDAPTTHRLAVYRIVQEALTNARKHADGALVTMRIDYRPPATLVEVTNPAGPPGPAAAAGSGYGLVGLRERVSALGGHLTVGPAGAGSWRLAARIPHPADTEENGTPA